MNVAHAPGVPRSQSCERKLPPPAGPFKKPYPSIPSAISNNFVTVFQLRAVPAVFNVFSMSGNDSFDRPMPSG